MDLIREKWNDFSIKHKLIAQFVKFYAFSLFVTVVQYLLLTFLPSVLQTDRLVRYTMSAYSSGSRTG